MRSTAPPMARANRTRSRMRAFTKRKAAEANVKASEPARAATGATDFRTTGKNLQSGDGHGTPWRARKHGSEPSIPSVADAPSALGHRRRNVRRISLRDPERLVDGAVAIVLRDGVLHRVA